MVIMNKFVIKLIRPTERRVTQAQRNVHVEAKDFASAEAALKVMVENGRLSLYPGEFVASISLAGYH